MEQGANLDLHRSGFSGRVLNFHKEVFATLRLERNCSVCLLLFPKDPLEAAGAALLSTGIQNLPQTSQMSRQSFPFLSVRFFLLFSPTRYSNRNNLGTFIGGI